MTEVRVRSFTRSDVSELLVLMRSLAAFEDYADDFVVTESDLLKKGLSGNSEFDALVAEDRNGNLLGMAVFYKIPYTHDLRPDLILKELYVAEKCRAKGVGRALMTRVIQIGKQAGCKRIKWLVLTNNYRAKRFYKNLGASYDGKWENWRLEIG